MERACKLGMSEPGLSPRATRKLVLKLQAQGAYEARKKRVDVRKALVIGTDFSGIETPLLALRDLGLDYEHAFGSEVNKA